MSDSCLLARHVVALRSGVLCLVARTAAGEVVAATTAACGSLRFGSDLFTARAWVAAPTTTFRTGLAGRDRRLHAALASDRFPTVRLVVTSVMPRSGAADGIAGRAGTTDAGRVGDVDPTAAPVLLRGTFLLHGVVRPVDAPGWLSYVGGVLRIAGAFTVDARDHGVRLPAPWLGLLRVARRVDVLVDLRFGDRPARVAAGDSTPETTGDDGSDRDAWPDPAGPPGARHDGGADRTPRAPRTRTPCRGCATPCGA